MLPQQGFPPQKTLTAAPGALLPVRQCKRFSVGWNPDNQVLQMIIEINTVTLKFYLQSVPHFTRSWHGQISSTKRKTSALMSAQCTNRLEMLMPASHNVCTDDLAIYSQRKTSSTLPLLSTPTLAPFKASFRNVSRLQPLIPHHQITWGKVQVQSRKQLWSSTLLEFARCLVGIQSSHCCSQGGPPRIKATKGLVV